MRDASSILDMIMKIALDDENILAVCLNGSRADKMAFCDKYSDFDIIYVVRDIRNYTTNKSWFAQFGDILICQNPDILDGYDFTTNEKFTTLMQFKDGSRIDLTLVDELNLKHIEKSDEPQLVLLNKKNIPELKNIFSSDSYLVHLPSQDEFFHCTNEFWWLTLYVAKGLCRDEITYAKKYFEGYLRDLLLEMLSWKITLVYHEKITLGKHYRYIKRYLSDKQYQKFLDTFADNTIEDIWNKLLNICEYFHEIASFVSLSLMLKYDKNEALDIIRYLKELKTKVYQSQKD